MKEKRRMLYESPCMDCIQVQAESDFMSGSIMEDPKSKVEVQGHEVGKSYDFDVKDDNGDDPFKVTW